MYYLNFCSRCKDRTLHDFHTDRCTQQHKQARLYNFVIFKNYDGSVESKTIPRDAWLRAQQLPRREQ